MAVKVKHHKGKYWVFIDHKGKRKAKCVGSKQAAETAAKKIEARLTLGDFSLLNDKPQRPFDAYFQQWLEMYVRLHCKPSTADRYQQSFRLFLRPALGSKDIAAITRDDLKKLVYALHMRGKHRNTVKATLTPLRKLLNHAVDDGHIAANPALRILRHSRADAGESQHVARFLTRDEVRQLLSACQDHFPTAYPFISLLVKTRLRWGEAIAVQWEDIDW